MEKTSPSVLVTGGAGYIGSHTVLELIQSGSRVVAIDNLSNGRIESLRRVERLAGSSVEFIHGDIRDRRLLDRVFEEYAIDAVVHFAGLKSVSESTQLPLDYYENNVTGSITLFQAMKTAGVFQLVFSSSATVYGNPTNVPISEADPVGVPTNAYGRSKLVVEQVLHDTAASDSRWAIALLRYFNPAGAHPSGLIGEDPCGIPNNLVPYVTQVALGELPHVTVFGGDYSTPDGTGVRDYVHVVDLAHGHIQALRYLNKHAGVHTWNLGTGQGYSVLQVIKAMEEASGRQIRHRLAERRGGDVAACWAVVDKAERELNWKAERGLDEMMADSWRWQRKNPAGYGPTREPG